MKEVGGKVIRTAVGICSGLIAAELVAIGAHAVIADAKTVAARMAEKMTKEPVKKGLFRR